MKTIILLSVLFVTAISFAQKSTAFPGVKNLNNVVVVGQLNELEDRYAVEINLNQLFASYGIKSNSSLNIVKQGGKASVLASDTLQASLKKQGFDTYLLISVRGYDKRFKASTRIDDMKTELESGHLFSLYREEIVSVSFELTFYKDGKVVENRLVKVGSVGSRDAVIKKFRKKMSKLIRKKWKLA